MVFRDQRGSLTVEATIMMIYVIGIVFMMVYIANGLYQRTYLQALANEASEMASRHYMLNFADYQTGYISELDSSKVLEAPLYFTKSSTLMVDTISETEAFVKKRTSNSGAYDLFNKEGKHQLKVTCKIQDKIIYKRTEVTIEDTSKSPFAFFLRLFGLSEDETLVVEAVNVVDNPDTFIRNLDLAGDLIRETELGESTMENVEVWRQNLRSLLEKWEQ